MERHLRNSGISSSSPSSWCCALTLVLVVLSALANPSLALTTTTRSPVDAAGISSDWEYAVSLSNKIVFLNRHWDELGHNGQDFGTISTLSYDGRNDRLFFNAKNKTGIFELWATAAAGKQESTNIAKDFDENSKVNGLAFDPVAEQLYWTDGSQKRIYSMDMAADSRVPHILFQFENETPLGIAIDICRRKLYWTTANGNVTTIERSSLFGAMREVLINSDLHNPIAIEVDQHSRRMYWLDDKWGTHISIESADLQGGNRRVLYDGVGKDPRSLFVNASDLYFTDFACDCIYRVDQQHNNTMTKVKEFGTPPSGLVIRRSFADDHSMCVKLADKLILSQSKEAGVGEKKQPQQQPAMGKLESTTTAATTVAVKDNGERDVMSPLCLNGGRAAANSTSPNQCQCKSGFTGSHCQVNLCYNFCVHGNCHIGSTGLPQCRCESGFVGPRCDQSLCSGYCLNDGRCEVYEDGQPVCICLSAFTGRHCEIPNSRADICRAYCVTGESFPNLDWVITDECKCDNITMASCSGNQIHNYVMYGVFAAVVITILVLVLLIAMNLKSYFPRTRPKIKKTFVVRKNGTPLTHRSQCEITIEDCCNMQYCDTPCFDPKLLENEITSSKSSGGSSSHACKEDKKELLSNMMLDGNGDLF